MTKIRLRIWFFWNSTLTNEISNRFRNFFFGISKICICGKDIDSGDLYIALEYMDLDSLDQMNVQCIQNMRDREMTVAYIMCNGWMVGLHKKLYVHNDIKSANILCNQYGSVKLADLALCCDWIQNILIRCEIMAHNGINRPRNSPKKCANIIQKQVRTMSFIFFDLLLYFSTAWNKFSLQILYFYNFPILPIGTPLYWYRLSEIKTFP